MLLSDFYKRTYNLTASLYKILTYAAKNENNLNKIIEFFIKEMRVPQWDSKQTL